MSGLGRDATSNLLSSAPETGRSSFASRKLPDAIECSRPTTVLHGTQDATAGDRVHRPLIATAHRQGFGRIGLSLGGQSEAAMRRSPVVRKQSAGER